MNMVIACAIRLIHHDEGKVGLFVGDSIDLSQKRGSCVQIGEHRHELPSSIAYHEVRFDS